MKREEIQKQAIDDLFGSGIRAGEIKTGTGKTKILLDLAKMHAVDGRCVIISTSNIHLAKAFFSEAEKFGFSMDMEALFGRNNYLNTSIVLHDLFLSEYGLEKKAVKDWIEANAKMLLAELFLKDFDLPDDALDEIRLSDPDERTLSQVWEHLHASADKEVGSVFVTNHIYLIYLMQYAKQNNLPFDDRFVTMFDEAHLLDASAKSVYSLSFSLLAAKTGISQLLQFTKPTEAMRKRLVKLKMTIADLITEIQPAEAEDVATTGTPVWVCQKIKAFVENKEVQSAYKYAQKNNGAGELFAREIREAVSIFGNHTVSERMIEMSFSAIRRQPSFRLQTNNSTFALREVMCKTGEGYGTVLVSGTLRITQSDRIKDNEWSFIKMGLFPYKKTEGEEERIRHNQRVASIVFRNYPYVFKNHEVKWYCATEEKYHPPKTVLADRNRSKKENEANYRRWITQLAELLSKTCLRNTVCLMSSFENSVMMAEEVKKVMPEYTVIVHLRGNTISETIERYKQSVDQGNKSILIGGLSFYTGIDLHGKYLSTLFIGKLPIEPKPSLTERVSRFLPSIQKDIRYKSLITFRQGIGRAKRREGNIVFVVVADPRIHNARYKHFKEFLSELGTPVSAR